MILTIQRLDKDLIFDFYNLSSPKYYSKFSPFELPNSANKLNNASGDTNNNDNTTDDKNKNDNTPIAPTFF